MTFNIVVCVKQVPDTDNIKWTANNTIKREGLQSVLNPYDLGAIEFALKYKAELSKTGINAFITVVTMGPNQAQNVLKEAISYGADKGVLLSDKKFAGADTLATAYTLSKFITTKIPDFKLIICGQQAVDGDTAQTPSSLAQKLSIGQITNIVELEEVNHAYSVLKKETTLNTQIIKSGYPVLLAVNNKNIELVSTINGHINAQNANIDIFDANDILADSNFLGLKGSPTKVKKTYKAENTRNTIYYESLSNSDYADIILNLINDCRS